MPAHMGAILWQFHRAAAGLAYMYGRTNLKLFSLYSIKHGANTKTRSITQGLRALPLVGVSIVIERERQQNDSLVNGCQPPNAARAGCPATRAAVWAGAAITNAAVIATVSPKQSTQSPRTCVGAIGRGVMSLQPVGLWDRCVRTGLSRCAGWRRELVG